MSTTAPSLPYAFAKRHGVVVLDGAGEAIQIGLREDAAATALIEVRRALGRPLQVARLPHAAFDRKLSEVYADAGLGTSDAVDQLDMHGSLDSLVEDIPATADLLENQDDAPIIRLINGLIAEGARLGASDIHIEPSEAALRVRFRVEAWDDVEKVCEGTHERCLIDTGRFAQKMANKQAAYEQPST